MLLLERRADESHPLIAEMTEPSVNWSGRLVSIPRKDIWMKQSDNDRRRRVLRPIAIDAAGSSTPMLFWRGAAKFV